MNPVSGFELIDSPSIWQNLLNFWAFNDANLVWVVLGTMVLGMSASMIGTFAFLRKRSLMGDALAHSALPGVMTAFILFQSKDPVLIFVGATLASFVGFFIIDWLPKYTKIKSDAAMAITLSFFFALGLMELSYIQSLEGVDKAGLDKMMFGQAAAMTQEDVNLLLTVAIFIIVTLLIFFDKFRLITFHRQYAQSMGVKVTFYELLLALLIVLSVVIGLQIVGVVLMAAVLLAPVAAAKYWSDSLAPILFISAVVGALSGLMASQISYLAPAMPTGPWMVLSLSFLFILSFVFGKKGWWPKHQKQRRLFEKVVEENILRSLYKINEKQKLRSFSEEQILTERNMSLGDLKRGLHRLIKKQMMVKQGGQFLLTELGSIMATELTRKHRLWENYLDQHMQLTDKAMHKHAEEVEHLLSNEETKRLEEEMLAAHKNPNIDPHGNPIPSSNKKRPTEEGAS